MLGPLENLITLNLLTAIMGLLVGVFLLWLSSETVIRVIGPIAKYFGVKELIVTILGVSVLSSLPEFTVSAFAAAQGHAEIALGNVIGSNFVTLTFVTALCALIAPLMITKGIKERESSWMILSTATIFVLAVDGKLSRIDGIVLMLLYIPYIITVIREAIDDTKLKKLGDTGEKEKKKLSTLMIHIAIGVAAIMGIVYGANITLSSGQFIGKAAGLNDLILGILIFALGTSLPELAVSLAATFKKKSEVTIGEVYASNIFTALFVLGACCLITPMQLFPAGQPTDLIMIDIPFLILAGVIIQIFVTTGSKLVRLEAVFIMGLYVYFILYHFFPSLRLNF